MALVNAPSYRDLLADLVRDTPSPYCGRLDDHNPHPWRGVHGAHECPGPPRITLCDRNAVEASVEAAR